MNDIIALIPARSGSKSVKDKNIKYICNHSLLEWSIKATKKAKLIDRVFVSTNSKKYAAISKEHGAEVPFMRPNSISKDSSSDLDFVKHAIAELSNIDIKPKYIVHIRPTTPLRNPKIIDKAISLFKKNKKFNSLRSVHKMSESSYKTFEIKKNNLKPLSFLANKNFDLNAPRQSFPETYQANGYVDILSTNFIKKSGLLHGNKILPFITDITYEVDTLEDFKYLEYLASNSKLMFDNIFK